MAPTASPPSPPPSRRPRLGPPAGLKNLGNTCYLNSVLQCLACTPPLATLCLSSRHSNLCKKVFPNKDKECAFCLLEWQIGRLLRAEPGALESPGKLIRCMPLFANHFRLGRQEDAHEFLRFVVDACHTAGLRIRKRLHDTSANGECGQVEGWGQGSCLVMKETFGGALLSQVKCLVCKGESNKTDDIMDINLDLHGSSSVGEALTCFFRPEILEGANKYSCERCKKLTVARKQMFIHRAPKVLVIQLKRFEGINGGKINKNIEFKEAIVLSDFMYNENQGQPVYNLFGSIVHSGLSPETGHYYAYVKDATNRWYCCNDAHVSSSSSQEVLSEKVYILFYILSTKNQKPSTNGYSYSAVKSSNTNGNGISNVTCSEPLKIPLVKQNGSYSTKAIAPLPPKNGKIAHGPVPHIKPIHLKNTGTEKVTSNGKANIISRTKPEVNEGVALSKPDGCESKKSAEPSERNVNSNILCDTLDANSQKILPDSNGNGHLNPVNDLQERHNAKATCAEQYSEHSSSTIATLDKKSCNLGNFKSSVLQQEVSANSLKDVVALVKDSAGLKRPLDEAKFKEMLAESASSGLRSSDWVDRVSNFMRSEKRRCVKNGGMPQDIDALRKQLKSDSGRKFRSEIPEPLMEHLIKSLRAYFYDKF